MIEDDLKRLIELNEKIVNQNDEIIRLLLKLNGEEEVESQILADEIIEENKVTEKEIKELLFDDKLNPGEVLFAANSQDNNVDIYKISVKKSDELKVSPPEIEEKIQDNFDDLNYEIVLDNLTGDSITYQFKTPLLVAFESLIKNMSIPTSVAILDDEQFINFPDLLRFAMERGAKTIHSPMKNSMAVLQAPPMIMNYLKFYKNEEHLLEILFD